MPAIAKPKPTKPKPKSNPAPPAAAAVISISSRYQKPGGPKGFGGPPVDLLTPTLPPIYPSAPKPSPLNRDMLGMVSVYYRLCQYLSSNYGVHIPKKTNCAFNVDRFTDKYNGPLTVNPDIVHRIGSDRLPDELILTSNKMKQARKRKTVRKQNIEDLPEDEEVKEEESGDGESESKKSRNTTTQESGAAADNEVIEEEEMDDADEELDMGTDYASNYFDNGEGFLDSDHDGDEDGPIY